MKKFIFSDFDGTLTTKDSMMSIIIYQQGRLGLVLALLRILPWLILMFMGRYSNQRTKERLLHHCFGRMTVEDFDDFCQRFADSHRHILRNNLYDKLVDEMEGISFYHVQKRAEKERKEEKEKTKEE